MEIEYSYHWSKQKKHRPDISDDLIELCIQQSKKLIDRQWHNAYNAILRIPTTGRTLKVVYREKQKIIKRIITAYWID